MKNGEWSEIGWMAHQSVLFIKYYYLFEWKCMLLPLFLILRFCFFFLFFIFFFELNSRYIQSFHFSSSLPLLPPPLPSSSSSLSLFASVFVCFLYGLWTQSGNLWQANSREIQWNKKENQMTARSWLFFLRNPPKSDCIFSNSSKSQ